MTKKEKIDKESDSDLKDVEPGSDADASPSAEPVKSPPSPEKSKDQSDAHQSERAGNRLPRQRGTT